MISPRLSRIWDGNVKYKNLRNQTYLRRVRKRASSRGRAPFAESRRRFFWKTLLGSFWRVILAKRSQGRSLGNRPSRRRWRLRRRRRLSVHDTRKASTPRASNLNMDKIRKEANLQQAETSVSNFPPIGPLPHCPPSSAALSEMTFDLAQRWCTLQRLWNFGSFLETALLVQF